MPKFKLTKKFIKRKEEFFSYIKKLEKLWFIKTEIADILQVSYQVLYYIMKWKHDFSIKKYINKINLINKYLNENTPKKNMK